jgi:hypothetical protein
MNIFPVEQGFNKGGFNYKLLCSKTKDENTYCIYEQKDKMNDDLHYEVQILRLQEVIGIMNGFEKYNGFTHYWKNPSNEDWGVYGWTYRTLKEADAKLDVLFNQNAVKTCVVSPNCHAEG